jgi:hypothetical protein
MVIVSSVIFGILAAICLIPSLYRGTVQDLKEFKFSETHFNSLWVNAAIIFDVFMYISLLVEGSWMLAVEFFALSVVASLIFLFIAFRYGGGGDWRALIFIAWIAPFILGGVIAASAVCGVLQAIYWLWRDDIDTPPLYRKIPFALSIFAGYQISLAWLIATALQGL